MIQIIACSCTLKKFVSTLQHEAHGSDVEEEKRRRVVNKNLKAMRMANAEKYQKVSLARTWTRLVKGGIFGD